MPNGAAEHVLKTSRTQKRTRISCFGLFTVLGGEPTTEIHVMVKQSQPNKRHNFSRAILTCGILSTCPGCPKKTWPLPCARAPPRGKRNLTKTPRNAEHNGYDSFVNWPSIWAPMSKIHRCFLGPPLAKPSQLNLNYRPKHELEQNWFQRGCRIAFDPWIFRKNEPPFATK